MDKRRLNQFHRKYPFVESIILFILGIIIGILSNLFTGDLSAEHVYGWRIIDSCYLWGVVSFSLLGVVYYWKFSSYSIGKQINSSQNAANTIIETLANETKKMLESTEPISFEKRLALVRKSTQVICEVDIRLLGGESDD